MTTTQALAHNLAFTYGVLAEHAGRRWHRSDQLSLADGSLTGAGALGLEPMSPSPLLRREPGPLHGSPTDLEIELVRDARELATFEATVKDGFGFPERIQALPSGAIFPARALSDDRVRFWLGSVAADPVGTAWSSVSDGVVGVYGVSTVERARRRGYGEALTAAAIRARPDLPAVLQSSPMGHPIYERMGFTQVGEFERWRRG